MDIYHIWFNLKAGVRDTEFAQNVHAYLGHLKEQGSLVGYRITRPKLGLGPPQSFGEPDRPVPTIRHHDDELNWINEGGKNKCDRTRPCLPRGKGHFG